MALPFLDTNIVLRHLLQDHPDHSPRATAYFRRIALGELRVRTSEIVVFEVVFTLERTYKLPKIQIRDAVLSLLGLPGIVFPGKRRFRKVFEYYIDLNISFADAYHIVFMERLNLEEVITFDRGFDRVKTITRVEP
jgi:predicted nucleic acid-binding protein